MLPNDAFLSRGYAAGVHSINVYAGGNPGAVVGRQVPRHLRGAVSYRHVEGPQAAAAQVVDDKLRSSGPLSRKLEAEGRRGSRGVGGVLGEP